MTKPPEFARYRRWLQHNAENLPDDTRALARRCQMHINYIEMNGCLMPFEFAKIGADFHKLEAMLLGSS